MAKQCNQIGELLSGARSANRISREILCKGLCSGVALSKIENGSVEADLLLYEMLLQRAGLSTDSLEVVLSDEEYSRIKEISYAEELIFKGEREKAEEIINGWKSRSGIQRMLYCKMKAMISFCLDNDLEQTLFWLRTEAKITMSGFSVNKINEWRISIYELETLLAIEKVEWLRKKDASHTEKNVRIYLKYIADNFADEEEKVKLQAKAFWLLGQVMCFSNRYDECYIMSKQAIVSLGKRNILYFMEPLLEMICLSVSNLKNSDELPFWQKVYEVVKKLRVWSGCSHIPVDIIHKTYIQRAFYLESELVANGRKKYGFSQEELADIADSTQKSISEIENGKRKAKRETRSRLLEAIKIDMKRLNLRGNESKYSVVRMRNEISYALSKRDYEAAQKAMDKLENTVDPSFTENDRSIQIYRLYLKYYKGAYQEDSLIKEIEKTLSGVINFKSPEIFRMPFRNEVFLINTYCKMLSKTDKSMVTKLYKMICQKYENSKIDVCDCYRTYISFKANKNIFVSTIEECIEDIRLCFRCGKATCLPSILGSLACRYDEAGNHDNAIQMAECSYYTAALYHVKEEYQMYGKYLQGEGIKTEINILH